jgi:Lrp/AsnC family leucine-responsive transcriptional regulator
MDETDFKILELLLEDGRMTFKEIAKKVGIDERRASRRVEKLINEGVIQGFTALIDWSKFGMQNEIWVGTRTGIGKELRDTLFRIFNDNANIVRVDSTVGTYEYVFHAICKDLHEFRSSIAVPLEPYTAGLSSSIITSSIKRFDLKPLLNVIKKGTLKWMPIPTHNYSILNIFGE